MTAKQHAYAIARFAVCAIEAAPARGRGRRLRELAGVASLLADGLSEEAEVAAHRVGVADLIEAARNEHLARLDVDDGLQALLVDWTDVALLVAGMTVGRRPQVRRRR